MTVQRKFHRWVAFVRHAFISIKNHYSLLQIRRFNETNSFDEALPFSGHAKTKRMKTIYFEGKVHLHSLDSNQV